MDSDRKYSSITIEPGDTMRTLILSRRNKKEEAIPIHEILGILKENIQAVFCS